MRGNDDSMGFAKTAVALMEVITMEFIRKVVIRVLTSALMLICCTAVSVKETVMVLIGKYDGKLFGDYR